MSREAVHQEPLFQTTTNLKPSSAPLPTNSKPVSTEVAESPLRQVRHVEREPSPRPLTKGEEPIADQLPIDLPTALRLAGADHLQIALAAERVRQAEARLEGAKALWLPTLDAGVGYNEHDGRIQDTGGSVIDVRRSSLFVGGGPKLGGDALNGGNNGPSRLALGLPLTDALFAPFAERQMIRA